MDDLLSVALSEAGIDEFFTENLCGNDGVATSLHSDTSDIGTSPLGAQQVPEATSQETSTTPSPRMDLTHTSDLGYESHANTSLQNGSFQDECGIGNHASSKSVKKLSSTSSVQESQLQELDDMPPALHAEMQQELPKQTNKRILVRGSSGPTRGAVRLLRPIHNGNANSSTPARGSPAIRRTISTPNGLETQLLRPYINEHGETVYRTMRLLPASQAQGRGAKTVIRTPSVISSSSTETAPQAKFVVVRTNTPNGPIFVRKMIPQGATITSTVDRSGNVIRRIVRGGHSRSTTMRRVHPVEYNNQSSTPYEPRLSVPQRSNAPESSRQILRSSYRTFTPSSSNIITRTSSGNLYPPSSRPGSALSSNGFEPGPSCSSPSPTGYEPGRRILGNESRGLVGVGGSTPSLTTLNRDVATYDDALMNEVASASLNSSMSAINRSHLLLDRRRPLQPLRISSGGDSTMPTGTRQLCSPLAKKDVSAPKTAQQAAAAARSQTAKEEMKTALQTAKERRDEEEEENLGYAETYADYRPAKLRSGLAHPDSVVETASLSSVAPPDVRYQISIPEDLIDTGAISALQLEAVIYACQAHERRLPSGERCGYLIGDGAGVGKGRTVACVIYENYLLGRKRAIWLSVSSDLKYDSERDLRDIGADKLKVYALNKLKYAKISGKENGNIKKGVIFATYSSLIGECKTAKHKYRSRLSQLVQWFGVDYDGVIILDECHRAKNLCPTAGGKSTKTGKAVLELQRRLPNARIVYASATGATEPRNMAYMTRIGLWGPGQPFAEFSDFINAVERRGVGAMEIVAMDMKQRGLYLARQLSFRGVTFRVEEVPLSDEFIRVYDESVKLWMECRRQFQAVLSTMSDDERAGCKQVWGQFWACHQRFFKYLCIGAKVEKCVEMTRAAIRDKKCIVIGLQSTGEARTKETLEEMGGELTDFVSTSKAVLQGLIEKHFPTERGSCMDIFRDIDRFLDDYDKPKKRKRPLGGSSMDLMEELGFGIGPTLGSRGESPKAKRPRATDSDSSCTSSDDDEIDCENAESSDGNSSSDDEVRLDKDEDWVNTILAEAASSSDSDDGGDSDAEPQQHRGCTSSGEEEINPFTCDFLERDPWAHKQQIVTDSPEKKSEEDLADIRRKKHEKRRRKKRFLREQKQKVANEKRVLETQAMKSSATQFITSSRIIEENGMGSDINPQMIKTELLAAVERLGPSLPANTLDQLIDELGGPDHVAEMTGRKGRVVTRENGEIEYELRHAGADVPLELMNMDEKDKFMKGEKMVAVISEAASSGISLQADRRAPNRRPRVHITLELPWSADKAIQQFGRTHRSNQVSAPEYVFLISELAGEKRFASIVAKRLESLGALTHGDRRATESRDLSQFNMDTNYGRSALDVLLRSVIGTLSPPLIPPPENYRPGDFFTDMRLYMEGVGLLSRQDNGQYVIEREAATIPKFLNRILGLPVHAQNALFYYFTDIVNELIAQAKHDGTYDMGIMDLGTGGDMVHKVETRIFIGCQEKGSYRVEIHKIRVERGVPWDDAFAIYQEHNTGEDGFYMMTLPNGGKKMTALVYGIGKRRLDTGARLYSLTKPATGRSPKFETFADLSKKFKKVTPEEAKIVWEEQYNASKTQCQHNYGYGKCRNETAGNYCEVGRSTRTYFVLSGSVLSVWNIVEDVLNGNDRRNCRIQIIRVRTDEDRKIVGLLVMPSSVRKMVELLDKQSSRSYTIE